jgi:hypothetical protein
MKKFGTPIGSVPGSENENGAPVPDVALADCEADVLLELVVVVARFSFVFLLVFFFTFSFVFFPVVPEWL